MLKILWISNYPLPDISKALNLSVIQNEGWKITTSEQLVNAGYNLTVAFPESVDLDQKEGVVNDIGYFAFATKQSIEKLLKKYNFDIVHIWGTEFAHSRWVVEIAKEIGISDKVVVSIQGIARECALHYYTGVEHKFLKKQCLVDKLRKKSIYLDALDMYKRADNEDVVLQNAHNIIGRTDFDRRYAKLMNKDGNYYSCNETLRECFYTDKWQADKCEKNTIFMSQATYPLKGLHHVLKALGIVKKFIPDVKLTVAGGNILKYNGNHPVLHKLLANHAYPQYLNQIIKENCLEQNIECIGLQDAQGMKNHMLKSNIFLLASNIENSPNSLGEAMLLSVPCIASNVGGVASMCDDNKDVLLYQHDDYFMLASRIIELLGDENLQQKLSKAANNRANITHNAQKNFERLIEIYQSVNG